MGSIALAAVLAAIVAGKGCDANVNTAPVATTPTTTQPAAAGSFSIATSADGKVTLSGAVPSEDAKTAAFTGAEAAWGAGNVINNLTVDANTGAIPGVDVIGKTIAALKGAGSGWTALFNGTDRLTLTGEVASGAVKSALVSAATAAFAPGTVVDQLTVKSGASEEAKKAVADINKEISLRGVTFVTGSANLTAASRTTLDRVAKLLDEADDVRAQVQGHTDNQGDAAANLALSTARAKAVVAYLVGKGVDANRLVAKGYGQTKPIATNDTEAGRAKNRRVVFAVIG